MSGSYSTAFSFLYYKTAGMSAFENLIPITDYPDVFGDVTTLDISDLSCDFEKVAPGNTSAPDITYGYIYSLDKLEKMETIQRVECTFQLRFGADGQMGCFQYTGQLVPQVNAGAFGDTRKGAFKIFPSSKVVRVDPAAVFIQPIGDKFVSGTGTITVFATTYPENATLAVVSSETGIATATVEANEITIKGVSTGTSVITVTASAAGLAGRTETFSVIVS